MSDPDTSGRPPLISNVRRNGESVHRVADWEPGDADLTPDDPRWREIVQEDTPAWLRGMEWKGIGGWPEAKPETLADVAEWLRSERAECNEWANIATETAADRLRVRLHNAAQLCMLVSDVEPPAMPQCGDAWQNAKANTHTLLSWLRDTSYDWQAANAAMLKEHELNVQATKPLAEELEAVVRQAISDQQAGHDETDGGLLAKGEKGNPPAEELAAIASDGPHPVDAREAAADAAELALDGQSLRLFRELRRHWFGAWFNTLAEVDGAWRSSMPQDSAIEKGLERLKAKVEEFHFEIEIRPVDRRAKLSFLPPKSQDK